MVGQSVVCGEVNDAYLVAPDYMPLVHTGKMRGHKWNINNDH